ncbi:MAG TPA: glycosyltransferase family 39 protein [Anaerolineae bacterium]|nr:glycosyltransferase family 39 protein [Anaerolineae bacterium]
MSRNLPPARRVNWLTWSIAIGLLLVACFLRVYAIDEIPPGLTHDEVSQLDVAAQVHAGDWRLLYPGGFALDGAEPGYYPFLSAAQSIWGANPLARRLPSLFAGLIGLACLYALAARLFNRTVGLLTLGAATVVWWSILMGRVILREVLEAPLYALALYGFWRGFESARQPDPARAPLRPFILAGVALGALQYVHTIPRGLFLVFVLFGLYLWVFHRPLFKRTWRGILALVVVAELLAAPVVISASLNPDLDNEETLFSLRLDGEDGVIQRLQANTPWILGQFAFTGDAGWEFNLPGRPIFQPPLAVFFGLGVLVALLRFRRPVMAYVLIVLLVSLLPSILLKPWFPFGRLVSAQTVAFAFVGLGIQSVRSGLARFVPQRAQVVRAGDPVAVVTYWRVIGPAPDNLMLFSHLYRSPTDIMAQQDQFDVGGSDLQPGDIFAQVHEFIHVPPDTPAGAYWIGTGMYDRESGERLPIYVGEQRAADRIWLTQLQVER